MPFQHELDTDGWSQVDRTRVILALALGRNQVASVRLIPGSIFFTTYVFMF
jgi:hypothetical protein